MKTFIRPSILLLLSFFVFSCQISSEKEKLEASNFFLRGNQKWKEKEYREALKWYNEAIEKNPQLSDAYYNRGLVNLTIEKPEEAFADFEQAFKIDPSFSAALFKKVEALQTLNKLHEAEKEGKLLVKSFPDSSANHRLLGDIYLQNKALSNALASYQIALKIDKNNLEAKINEGVVYQEMGELDLAEKSFQSVLASGKYTDLIYNNLGYLEIQRKQYERAKKWIDKALYLSPNNELYLRNLKRIEDESGLK